ncbi:helicase-associated domain-containing protein [uncultured Microbacterium sp.]|uniref:helicase-associated domain-containing protein n=1 Tax=uncultured Microbacterium sp. TaxID=191216 RepID=UPI0025E7C511|nr:helicase-associated domain-containing protein [uncultured Microbacterium sp.]
MPDGVRLLAERLIASDDDALAAAFAVRRVAPDAQWSDFFDAADALLTDASVHTALAALPAAELAALAAGHAGPEAQHLLLADADGAPLPAVRDVLDIVLGGGAGSVAEADVSGASASLPSAPPLAAAEQARVAENAFAALSDLADLLLRTDTTPLALIGSGALAAADRKVLAEELQRPDTIDDLLLLAELAGLVARLERRIIATAGAQDWLAQGATDRWFRVADAWANALPAPLRAAGGSSGASAGASAGGSAGASAGGFAAVEAWAGAYPADPAWPARAAALAAAGATWGALGPEGSLAPWASELGSDPVASTARTALAALLPAEVDRIYLQNDLTAIAPGPLQGELDARLRRLARRESHAQASTYRFSAASIADGMAAGESEASTLAFLTEISLTGVPQPLEYLVRQAGARFGAVRVVTDAETGRTRVESADTGLIDQIAIDQALRPLGLVDDGEALATRVGRDAVLWALRDARYPAVAVGLDGDVVRAPRHRAPAAPAAADVDYAPLIARLRGADADDADAAWLTRELDAAVRARAAIEVDVALPGGETRTFVLEAAGLGGGRLRGKDLAADVERTLPVSSISAVRRR